MKTEREIYLKPLTLREQVAMEQGICAGSVDTPVADITKVKAMAHGEGFDSEDGDTFTVSEWK